MEKWTDEVIIRQLQSGNEQANDAALTYLYRVSKGTVSRFILRNKGNEQDVDDIFHDGLIAFYKLAKADKIRLDTNVEAYLYSICRNMWAKKLMKSSRQVELTETHDYIETKDMHVDILLQSERKSLIGQLLKELGEECEKVLLLYYYECLKMKEIVERMHYANEQVVRNKKSKCMKKLRETVLNSAYYQNLLKAH